MSTKDRFLAALTGKMPEAGKGDQGSQPYAPQGHKGGNAGEEALPMLSAAQRSELMGLPQLVAQPIPCLDGARSQRDRSRSPVDRRMGSGRRDRSRSPPHRTPAHHPREMQEWMASQQARQQQMSHQWGSPSADPLSKHISERNGERRCKGTLRRILPRSFRGLPWIRPSPSPGSEKKCENIRTLAADDRPNGELDWRRPTGPGLFHCLTFWSPHWLNVVVPHWLIILVPPLFSIPGPLLLSMPFPHCFTYRRAIAYPSVHRGL